ncbi:MAG: hypothetical protein V4659_00705 [Pseudomonadota bacterium]
MVGDLQAFERSLRACFAAAGRLTQSAAEADAEQNLGGLAGHQIYGSIATAQIGISTAITATATGHRQLATLGKKLGFDVQAWGDGQKPPEEPFFGNAIAAPNVETVG